MITKPLLFALIAACGVSTSCGKISTPTAEHPEIGTPVGARYFCCDSGGNYDGDGGIVGYGRQCQDSEPAKEAQCVIFLACPQGYVLSAGEVTCPL